jgi:predicted TIM-barrel fold metal-dependent hydrolase
VVFRGDSLLPLLSHLETPVTGITMLTRNISETKRSSYQPKHPIIDADGHWLEFEPILLERLKKIGGSRAVLGFPFDGRVLTALNASREQRKKRRLAREGFWRVPTRNTLDRATATFPRLLYERLDELRIDFSILYPTNGLGVMYHSNDEIRRVTCRSFNIFVADFFGEFADRIAAAAVIPMHTPDEAIEELEYVVKQLGLRVAVMASLIRRPVNTPTMPASPSANWTDVLGMDSEYDYDPVWAKCLELGISPTFHTGSAEIGLRKSPTNYVYNHIGHFAAANEALCKAIFLGGVTRRFPKLKLGFLEGGVAWGCGLYNDLISHWKKRNRQALEEVNPVNLDRKMFSDLGSQYAKEWIDVTAKGLLTFLEDEVKIESFASGVPDDFAACKIGRAEDVRDLFVNNFYFGCEADDPFTAHAFNRRNNPFEAKLNVLFGSDIGHFDVQDMRSVVLEAHQLVTEGLISEEDFRDFTFANAVRFWGEANPNFFRSTGIEKEAHALLSVSKPWR